MEGKNVEIFLKTPLFTFKYVFEKEEKQLLEGAVRISGKVTGEKTQGVVVKVEAISNQKTSESKLPFEDIFVPFSKVDYIIIS